MISSDQPTIFSDRVIVKVSSIDDGPMNFRGNDPDEIQNNRVFFLEAAGGIDPLMATLVQVSYEDTTDFTRYKPVEEENVGEGILEPSSSLEADALVAARPDQALFLPLADCIGAVIYDPRNEILMVSHLGRHSVEQNGGQKSVEYLKNEFDSNPADLKVWLSPAAGKENYPLHALNNKGLHEAVVEQMVQAGINFENIEVSHVDTTESLDYFSHSEFLKGNRTDDGRFAIVAMMVE
jgi:copper oxidase (laccase) domain-containing protein